MTHPPEAIKAVARALVYDFDSLPDAAKKRALLDATALLDQIAPLLTAQAVKVKPLVWEESVRGRFIGTPPNVGLGDLGFWIFRESDGRFKRAKRKGWDYYITLEAAKAAAQADYEARILASVEAVPVAQAVEAERIACTEELRLAVAAARAEERERAAKVADSFHAEAVEWAKTVGWLDKLIDETDSSRIAAAIRKQEGV